MTTAEMQERLFRFALAVMAATRRLPQDAESRHVALQLFRAATSVASNYRAACLARSRAEFLAKLGTVREEADEASFWLEFIHRARLWSTAADAETSLHQESIEIAAMVGAAYRTTRNRYGRKPRNEA